MRKSLISVILLSTGLLISGCAEDKTNLQEKGEKVAYSSEGADSVMQGVSSKEHLSEWQVRRAKEFNLRNRNFIIYDHNKDGVLSFSELEQYLANTSFDSRFL